MKNTTTAMILGMVTFAVANLIVLGFAVRATRQAGSPFTAQVAGGSSGTNLVASADPAKLKEAMAIGQTEYVKCAACHGADGKGLNVGGSLMAPSLAGSSIAIGDPDQAALVVLKGIRKEGTQYLGVMAPLPLDEKGLAGVLTYVRNSFGNSAGLVTPEEAAGAKARFMNVPDMVGRNELDSLLASHPKVAANAVAASSSAPAAGSPGAGVAVPPPVKPAEPWVPIPGVRVVGGRVPSQRPVEAPPQPAQPFKNDQWYRRAVVGVERPYPSSFQFLDDQESWYTPFTHPGMTGPYDIRNWHQ